MLNDTQIKELFDKTFGPESADQDSERVKVARQLNNIDDEAVSRAAARNLGLLQDDNRFVTLRDQREMDNFIKLIENT